MGEENLNLVDACCERLAKHRGAAIQYNVFLQDITRPERWEKYGNSFAGHIINLEVIAVENSLVLWASRVWDNSEDSQSIPNAVKGLESCLRAVIRRRQSDFDATIQDRWLQKQFSIFRELRNSYDSLANSPVRNVVRVLRSENLAHLLPVSRDRERLFPGGFEGHNVIRNDLFGFVEASVKLIDSAELLRTGHIREFDEDAEVFQSYCDAFWSAVPKFREVEQDL